jgi:hypothetical protein
MQIDRSQFFWIIISASVTMLFLWGIYKITRFLIDPPWTGG